MKIIIYFILSFQISCTCDLDVNFLYNYVCVSKDCLFEKINRFQSSDDNISININGEVKSIQSSTLYQINITYLDTQDNQLVSDPVNCLDWRLYQTANHPDTNPTRQHVQTYNAKPDWPQSTYHFDNNLNESIISFVMTQDDLDNKQCYSYTKDNNKYWECYFEFAFIFQNITQVSHYFSIKIHADLNTGNQLNQVDFDNIQSINQCNNNQCNVNVNVQASLYFCSNSSCLMVQEQPFNQLILNQPFWMKYQIDDTDFDQFKIMNQTVTFQSSNLRITMVNLTGSQFQVIVNQPGYSIAELRVPLVSSKLVNSGSRLLQNDGNNIVAYATRTSGSVIEEISQNNTQNQSTSNLTGQKVVLDEQSYSYLRSVIFMIPILILLV